MQEIGAWALAMGLALGGIAAWAAPHYVDLSAVANVAPEDDGAAGNGKGGWTDEGINDMYLFPPLPTGDAERNGHLFRMIDPAANNGLSAVMLRGEKCGQDKPESVRVEVPGVKGKYVYFIQQGVGGAAGSPGYQAATYTVEYADGGKAEIPIIQGRHLLHWWCSQWWENRERDAWPMHMGKNVYTEKWGQLIGLWATQWQNPHPEKPITAMVFASAGKANPVIWAVTIDDADYHADEALKKGNAWVRPGGVPKGYFEPKLAMERQGIYQAAVEEGFVEGVRSVEVIRGDLIAVTVDPALTKVASGPCGEGSAAAATHQVPATFTVASETDGDFGAGVHPVEVGRDSYEYWNGNIGPFPQSIVYWHTFYLRLPRPLRSGNTYRVTVKGIEAPLRASMDLAYDEASTPTRAIKVNQVAYAAKASRRYAYLGWWAGDLGMIDYGSLAGTFSVIDEATGKAALSGTLARREAKNDASGEQVWEMDLATLGRGRFHIQIPGLGRSASFEVGGQGVRDLFFHTQRAFYHQRCGFPLEEPYTRFVKPACHLWVYESGYMVDDPNYTPKPDEAKREYRGGYHDAADFDCFTYHLRATAQNLDAYELNPALFTDKQLNIPESGNGMPDILDEARWALFFYREHQEADGGVPKGRCNDQDSRRQGLLWGPFGIFRPEPTSNLEYAATAASFARLCQPHDAAMAKDYLDSAVKAFDWAMAHRAENKNESIDGFQAWAAGALFRATGDQRFAEAVRTSLNEKGNLKLHWKDGVLAPMMRWQYIQCTQPGTDAGIQETMRKAIIQDAEYRLANRTDAETYRWDGDSKRGLGWGNGNGGGHYADLLLRAWWLTGERKYLDAASLNADFQLGCNPLSKTFISGMGARPPNHPQISAFLYERPGKRGGTVQGITIYGLAGNEPKSWHPSERPALRRWRDLGNGGAEISSEFTITETIGFSAMLYAALYADDQEQR
jgi:endoglucanase